MKELLLKWATIIVIVKIILIELNNFKYIKFKIGIQGLEIVMEGKEKAPTHSAFDNNIGQ